MDLPTSLLPIVRLFVCITKLGRFSKTGSPGIFQREHVTTAFYTRSGGLMQPGSTNLTMPKKIIYLLL
jgi:hypothetical protein